MANELTGKVVIVTGAGSPIGMGRSMSLSLARAGAKVAMMDIDAANLEDSASFVRSNVAGAELATIVADVTSPEDAERVVATTISELGGLHVLINNAGTNQFNVGESPTTFEPFWTVSPGGWARVVAVNFSGPFLMARAAMPHLLEQKWGRIIGVTTSLDTMIRVSMCPYGPSKAGHEALVATMAKDMEGTGVTANVLVPGGPVNTNLLPPDTQFDRQKLIQPDIMMIPVIWLASEGSDGINGLRFVAYDWDESLPLAERIEKAGAPAAWPQLESKAVYPA